MTSQCQNCDWKGPDSELGSQIEDTPGLLERVSPGEPMPTGECPVCGALCQPCDIVTRDARAILDALQPHEWYTTDREDTIVVSLDGDTALRLVVTPTPLPAVSPYDSDDNRYPEGLAS